MSAEEVFELSNAWAKEYDEKLAALYAKDEQYAKDILNIDRENKKPRKDLAKWSDIPDYISYMYDETFMTRTLGFQELNQFASRAAALPTLRNTSKILTISKVTLVTYQQLYVLL